MEAALPADKPRAPDDLELAGLDLDFAPAIGRRAGGGLVPLGEIGSSKELTCDFDQRPREKIYTSMIFPLEFRLKSAPRAAVS